METTPGTKSDVECMDSLAAEGRVKRIELETDEQSPDGSTRNRVVYVPIVSLLEKIEAEASTHAQ